MLVPLDLCGFLFSVLESGFVARQHNHLFDAVPLCSGFPHRAQPRPLFALAEVVCLASGAHALAGEPIENARKLYNLISDHGVVGHAGKPHALACAPHTFFVGGHVSLIRNPGTEISLASLHGDYTRRREDAPPLTLYSAKAPSKLLAGSLIRNSLGGVWDSSELNCSPGWSGALSFASQIRDPKKKPRSYRGRGT
jgi:hypothetical protein